MNGKATEARTYPCNASEVTIIFDDITRSKAEVIASSDDTMITMSGGVSAAILRAGGSQIIKDAQKQLPASIGDVIVSTAGNLPQKYIFHCLTIDDKYLQETWAGLHIPTEDKIEKIIRDSIRKCFQLVEALNISSIAFPVIGSGSAHMPFKFVIEKMADEISKRLLETNRKLSVEIYVFEDLDALKINELDFFETFSFKFGIANYIKEQKSVSYQNRSIKLSEEDMLYYNNQQHDVFISYKREEKQQAFAIKELLESWDIKTWIDKDGIFSSYDFKEVIEKAIESAKIVIFMSSELSNKSDYVKAEIKYAINCGKRIVPVMLDNTPFGDGIRMDLTNTDQVDYNKPDEFSKKLQTSIGFILRNYS